MPGTYDTRDEAIVAALDELQPGGTLYVHQEWCTTGQVRCTCTPHTWIYPPD
jgi:hypothetical protein